MRTNEDTVAEGVNIRSGSCPASEDNSAFVRAKIISVLKIAQREVSLLDLLENLAPESTEEEETMRAAVNTLLLGGKIDLSPTRKLLLRDKSRSQHKDDDSATEPIGEGVDPDQAAAATA
jgi:hypothetical protein